MHKQPPTSLSSPLKKARTKKASKSFALMTEPISRQDSEHTHSIIPSTNAFEESTSILASMPSFNAEPISKVSDNTNTSASTLLSTSRQIKDGMLELGEFKQLLSGPVDPMASGLGNPQPFGDTLFNTSIAGLNNNMSQFNVLPTQDFTAEDDIFKLISNSATGLSWPEGFMSQGFKQSTVPFMGQQNCRQFGQGSLVSDMGIDWSLLEGCGVPSLMSNTSPTFFLDPKCGDVSMPLDPTLGMHLNGAQIPATIMNPAPKPVAPHILGPNSRPAKFVSKPAKITKARTAKAVPKPPAAVTAPICKSSPPVKPSPRAIEKVMKVNAMPSEAELDDFFASPKRGRHEQENICRINDTKQLKKSPLKNEIRHQFFRTLDLGTEGGTSSAPFSPQRDGNVSSDSESEDEQPYNRFMGNEVSSPNSNACGDEQDEIPRTEVEELFLESFEATPQEDRSSMGLQLSSSKIDWVDTPAQGFSWNQIAVIQKQMNQMIQLTIQSYAIMIEINGDDHVQSKFFRSQLVVVNNCSWAL
jgi:hypothetical protein